jgi:hypothetical protein
MHLGSNIKSAPVTTRAAEVLLGDRHPLVVGSRLRDATVDAELARAYESQKLSSDGTSSLFGLDDVVLSQDLHRITYCSATRAADRSVAERRR